MSDPERNYTPVSNTLLSIQLLILGCVIFLVLAEIGVDDKAAANMLMLCWFAGLVVFSAPGIQYTIQDIRDWWGDRSV